MKRVIILLAISILSFACTQDDNDDVCELEGDFSVTINSDILGVYDFNLYENMNVAHEWYVLSREDLTLSNYIPIYSSSTTTVLPSIDNINENTYYTIIHKMYSEECGEIYSYITIYYSNDSITVIPFELDANCLIMQYWPNGPNESATIINADFDAKLTLTGVMTVMDFELFEDINAEHIWTISSSSTNNNFTEPYTLVYTITTTDAGPIILNDDLPNDIFYKIEHTVKTVCSSYSDSGYLYASYN